MCVWWHVVIFFDLFINKKCWVDIGCCLIDILHSWLKEINSNICVLALLANFLRVLLHNIHTHTQKKNLFKQNYNERAKKFFLNRFLPATFQIYIFLFFYFFLFSDLCVMNIWWRVGWRVIYASVCAVIHREKIWQGWWWWWGEMTYEMCTRSNLKGHQQQQQ